MQRNQEESFEQYQARRAAANKATKEFLKGTLFHDSNIYGTYANPQKRSMKEARKAAKEAK